MDAESHEGESFRSLALSRMRRPSVVNVTESGFHTPFSSELEQREQRDSDCQYTPIALHSNVIDRLLSSPVLLTWTDEEQDRLNSVKDLHRQSRNTNTSTNSRNTSTTSTNAANTMKYRRSAYSDEIPPISPEPAENETRTDIAVTIVDFMQLPCFDPIPGIVPGDGHHESNERNSGRNNEGTNGQNKGRNEGVNNDTIDRSRDAVHVPFSQLSAILHSIILPESDNGFLWLKIQDPSSLPMVTQHFLQFQFEKEEFLDFFSDLRAQSVFRGLRKGFLLSVCSFQLCPCESNYDHDGHDEKGE